MTAESSSVKLPKRIQKNYPDINNSSLLLYLPFGNGIGSVSYQGGNEQEVLAPEGFYITNDKTIYICDTVNARVLVYKNNKLVSEMILDNKYSIIDIFVENQDEIYLLDRDYKILKTSQDGIIENIYNIPTIVENETELNSGVLRK
jgi:hypothetical protein